MGADIKPPIGVVIPAFGHPKFLAEAIVSACEQHIDQPLRVVVVDDGCRLPETGETVSQLMPRYQDTLFYLRQKNTRLPGARNSGIRFLLNLEPEIDTIYLLDADNRLSPNSLKVFRDALGNDPRIGWAYPDISFFGLTRGEDGFDTRETAPKYSPLKHLIGNISEAGSMVRAGVFRAGVMFDESMTSGFEDWEFWLSALDAGYHGVRALDSGFMYRGRPESMLADSKRQAAVLVDYIRSKHKTLYDPKNIMAMEHQEAPFFAFYIPEEKQVYLLSDPLTEPLVYEEDEFRQKFMEWAHSPEEYFFPVRLFVTSAAIWKCLSEQSKYLRWFFWQLREVVAESLLINLHDLGSIGLETLDYSETDEDDSAHILSVASSFLWSKANGRTKKMEICHKAFLSLPAFEVAQEESGLTRQSLLDDFNGWTETWFPLPEQAQHASKTFAGPHSRSVREILVRDICAFEGREPFPACINKGRTLVAFKASLLHSAPAMGKLTGILHQLNAKPDHETILLLECDTSIENIYLLTGPQGWPSLVDTIIPYNLPGSELEYSIYLGKPYRRELTGQAPDDLAIFARTVDSVIACGSVAAIEALGEARLHGAKGSVFLAPEFLSDQADSAIALAKLLAFEHAIGVVATDDENFPNALSAQGFPLTKFVGEAEFLGSL